MIKTWIGIILSLAGLAACAPMAAGPVYGPAPTVQASPGQAVIYVVRTIPDTSYLTAPITLDGQQLGATFAGTYMRLEVPAGRHRIAGAFQDIGSITLNVAADRVYFVQHSVSGSWRATSPMSFFTLLDEPRGRAALARTSEKTGIGT
jgi:hypothetical protein